MTTKGFSEIFSFRSQSPYCGGSDFSDVTFKQDFGPWKKDEHVEILVLDLEGMVLGEFDMTAADDNPGEEIEFKKSCELKFVPKENSVCLNPAHALDLSLKTGEKPKV
jgi:hypothetical protein